MCTCAYNTWEASCKPLQLIDLYCADLVSTHVLHMCTPPQSACLLSRLLLLFYCVRDESVMFIEALFALDSTPGKHLIPPAANTGHTRAPLIPYTVALRAIAAHIYTHMAASLARCMRAAVDQLGRKEWLQVKLTEAAASQTDAAAPAGAEEANTNSGSTSSNGGRGPQGRGKARPPSGGGSKGAGKAVQGLDLEQSHIILQRVGVHLFCTCRSPVHCVKRYACPNCCSHG